MLAFDPDKDAANVAKHGLSLRLAEQMGLEDAVVVQDIRRDYGEERWVAYQEMDGRVCVLVFTMRAGALRPISLRKANEREQKFFKRRRYGGSAA